MNEQQLQSMIEGGETLQVEFKSDRKQMSDATIYEEIVAMANSQGGTLLIGVEDGGSVSGARPRHGIATEPTKLQSAIFNNTVPNINTRVSVVAQGNRSYLSLRLPLIQNLVRP